MSRKINIIAGAISIREWCQCFGLSRSTWYALVASGTAPKTFRVGTRILISGQAAADWVKAREAANENSGRGRAAK